MSKVRTRFAPSPTGRMHVGNLRTALYEFLIAKHAGGDFILRIEDTDRERYVEGAVDIIYRTLEATGLVHDEGPDKDKGYGPYIQSERQASGLYLEYAKKLIESGDAYYCFCDKDRLATLKTSVGEDGKEITMYDKHCLHLSQEEIQANLDAGKPYVIRMNMPTEGTTTFVDELYGEITVENKELDDMILIKSDGYPTYNFANVIDDHLQEITHVVRGNEYISSSPKYQRLYEAFGWEAPKYVHLPLITDENHKKLSKRSGHSSYEDLVKQGFLPEAIVNYIALLGWSPEDNQEIFSLDELIKNFDYHKVNKSPSVFDITKLKWMNGEYIKAMDNEKFYEMARPYVKAVIKKDLNLETIMDMVKTRIETFPEIGDMIDFFQELPEYSPEMYTHKKMKTNSENSLEILKELLPILEETDDYSVQGLHDTVFEYIKKKEIAHLVIIENILLGILAFVLAIPIGFLFSQFVSLVIVNLLGIPKTLFISLNFVSIGLLIIYFLTIYVLVLLNLLRRISKMTIRDFLYFDKQNEKKMFRDSKKRNVIFVLSIILGAISLFLWNSRCTMDNFNKQETLTYLMVSVIMLIISIYGISTTCADMFLTVLLKNKKMKYQNDNLFVARTFASKARTMSFTFGTLSMLILISLLALNYSSINKASYDISVNLNAPYDVQLFDDKQVFDEYIRVIEEEYTIDNTIEYDIYKEPNHQVQNFFQSEYYDFDPVLKLSDYNRLLELRKMPLLSLNDNEYYIVTNSKFAYEVEDNKDIETITVANKNLKLKGYDTKSYWNSITNTGRFVVVLPDKYVQGLEVSENHLIIDTKEDTDAELENKIKEDMQHQLVKVDENGEINDESYRVNVRGAEIEQQKAMVAIVVSLFMYIAFILISAVGTILAVQSLSDSTKYKYRYLTLRRLGINDKSLFKTIRKQLLILFCVPAISAILCSFVMMSSLNNVYQQILGDKHLYLMYFGLNLIIFFLIYSIYWIATYIGFKRNINEAS